MISPDDRPTRLPLAMRANVTSEELLVLMSRLEGAESERDALREQVRTLREALTHAEARNATRASTLRYEAPGAKNPGALLALAAECERWGEVFRAALASTETEVKP